MEPVRVIPAPARLPLHGLEQLRHPAGEPLSVLVAGAALGDPLCASALAHRVRVGTVRLAIWCARLSKSARLVLT
jgi:hypothetical protein